MHCGAQIALRWQDSSGIRPPAGAKGVGMAWLIAAVLVVAAVLVARPIRRRLLSDPLLGVYRRILPPMSQTEQEAIDAGTVWWDGELFSGRPAWQKLLAFPAPKLSAEEQSFLDNECEQLCAMVSDWDASQVW